MNMQYGTKKKDFKNHIDASDIFHLCGKIVWFGAGCPKPDRWANLRIQDYFGHTYAIAGKGSIMLSIGDMIECDTIRVIGSPYGLNGVQYVVRPNSLIVPVAKRKDEVIGYLSGPAFKGIGQVTAGKLFAKYKQWTIPVISSDHFDLFARMDGWSDSVIAALQEGMKESSIYRKLLSVFPHMPGSAINRILEQTGGLPQFEEFVNAVKAHPYVILHDVYSVNLKATDSVALYDCGIALDTDERLAFMMRKAVYKFCSDNHATYVQISNNREWYGFIKGTFDKIDQQMAERLRDSMPDLYDVTRLRTWLSNYIRAVRVNGQVVVDGEDWDAQYPYGRKPRLDANGCEEYALYTQEMYKAERFLCDTVRNMSEEMQPAVVTKRFSRLYRDGLMHMPDELQQIQLTHPLDAIQKDAVKMPWQYRLSFITGGPGRGKTSCLAAMIHAWRRGSGNSVILLAPTGRAIKRMQQQTGYDCGSTIARFLMLNKVNKLEDDEIYDPLRNVIKTNPSVLVVVDEASMLCFTEAMSLLQLVRDCTVVFVGDKDQLPPIEPGPFLQQCLLSNVIHMTELKHNYRSGKCDWVDNPEKIIQGGTFKDLDMTNDFVLYPMSDELSERGLAPNVDLSDAEQYIVGEYASYVRQDEYSSVMLLSPFSRSPKHFLTTLRLNYILQNALNPLNFSYNTQIVQGNDPFCGRAYYEGRGNDTFLNDSNGLRIRTNDRIMNTKNFPEEKILLFKNNSMEMRDLLTNDEMYLMFDSIPSGIYNGDIGTVRRVYKPFGRDSFQMLVELESDPVKWVHGVTGQTTLFSRFVLIDIGDDGEKFDNWTLAYALTVHKAQGCEAPHVIIAMPSSVLQPEEQQSYTHVGSFITQNLLYTAVTRSSETVTIVGKPQVVNEFMKHPYLYKNVRLADMLNGTVN